MNKRVYPLTFHIIMLIILNILISLHYIPFNEGMLSMLCTTFFTFWIIEKIHSKELNDIVKKSIMLLEEINNTIEKEKPEFVDVKAYEKDESQAQ